MNATHTCHGSFGREDHLCGCDRGRDHTEMQHKADMAERDQKEVSYTGSDDLVAWLRNFSGPGSTGTNEAADKIEDLQVQLENLRNISNANGDWSVRYGQACDERDQIAQVCESLSAENETLRGNLKSLAVFYKDARGDLAELSVEWGYRDRDDSDWVTPEDERHARLMGDLHPDEIVTVRRLVGQWTEVIA